MCYTDTSAHNFQACKMWQYTHAMGRTATLLLGNRRWQSMKCGIALQYTNKTYMLINTDWRAMCDWNEIYDCKLANRPVRLKNWLTRT